MPLFLLVNTLLLLLLCVVGNPVETRQAVAFDDPRVNGGSILDSSAGLGEPLNVIVSGLSSPEVLTDDGFLTYVRAIGFAEECFGLHIGDPQTANLGDGQGSVDELAVIRQSFDVPIFGTCLESLIGGNHFRYWRQSTTGALFLAASKEEDASENHNIVPDGYDIGRDELVSAVQGNRIWFDDGFKVYTTSVEDVSGLLPTGSDGINHGIAIDGVVKLLTVTVRDL